MELDVTKALLAPGTEFPFSAGGSLPPQQVLGETVTFDPVSLTGSYSALDGTVRLTGRLETVARAKCALCLKPAEAPLDIPFDETFRKDANELEDEDFRYEGNRVPLIHLALTLVMLNLPMRFLCREGCEGSEAYRTYIREIPEGPYEEEPQMQRPFEGLQDLLEKGDAGKTH
jgi:uncharacterized metal-binding protein YceD (DUF177 family)